MAVKLDQQKIFTALAMGRKYDYLPFYLHIYDSVNSTNQTLCELINQGAKAGTVVIATEQTAGRGQWGRQWISQTGGLYLSVAIHPHLEANASYQLTFATAWGIANQLRECGIDVGIKWPNDLVLEGRKLGGILTETKVNQGKITQAVVGVGINWANPVPETGINLKSWLEYRGAGEAEGQERQGRGAGEKSYQSPIPDLETLICQVLLGIESGVVCLLETGVSVLLSRYLECLVNMGDRVYVNDLAGNVVGVTPQGSLRVSLEEHCITDMKTPEIHLEPGRISLGYRSS